MNWKRVAAWTAVSLTALLALFAAVGILTWRSQAFHRYLLEKIAQEASAALNTRVDVQNVAIQLSPLSADLYGVVVQGQGAAKHPNEPAGAPPLLTADHLHIRIKIPSLLGRRWNLDEIVVDHPVARLLVDAQGQTNLPPHQSDSQSQTNLFDVSIGHAQLNGGEAYYNDRKLLVDADLRELNLQSAYDSSQGGSYRGTLSYRDGHLRYDRWAPVAHDLSASFDATRGALVLRPVTIDAGGSRVKLEATLRDYSNPVVDATYQAEIDATEARRILHDAALPEGRLRLTGSAHHQPAPNRPLLEALSARGELSSPVLLVSSAGVRTEFRDLAARFNLADGNLEVPDLRARLLGGELTANASIERLRGEQRGRLHASVRGASLAQLQTLTRSAALEPVRLGGTLNGDVRGSWSGSMRNLLADIDATLSSSIASRQSGGAQAIALEGALHAHYAGTIGELRINNSTVKTPQTTLAVDGALSPASEAQSTGRHPANTGNTSLQVALTANSLHELETLAALFRPPTSPPKQLGLQGKASFRGTVRGTLTDPQLGGQLVANDLQVKGSRFRLLRANIAANSSRFAVENGELDPLPRGRLSFSGSAGVKKWAFGPDSAVALTARASQLSVADLAHAAGVEAPLTGTLDAEVAIQGTERNPTGQGQLTLTRAAVAGEPIQSLNVRFQGTEEVAHLVLVLRAPVGAADGQLTYRPKQESYELSLQAPSLRLDRLQNARLRNLRLQGVLNLEAQGRGTLKNPGLEATARIPELQIAGQTVRAVDLKADVAQHQARFTLDSQAVDTAIRARGNIALEGDYPATVALDTPRVSLAPLFATYFPAQAQEMRGQTELHATVRGPLKNRQRMEAHLTIPVLEVAYQQLQVAATGPIRADLVNGVVTLQPAEIKGTGTDLHLGGEMPLLAPAAENATGRLTLTGNVDLQLLRLVQPDVESHGQVQLDIRTVGTRSRPSVEGQVRIVDGGITPPDSPIGLQHANGVLTLANQRLDITQFRGDLGGGTLTMRGGVIYGRNLQFDLSAAANGVTYVYQGIRAGVDGKLAFTGTPQASLVSGQVTVNRISVSPDFDASSLNSGPEVATPPGTGFTQTVRLNIGVQSVSQLTVASRTMSVRGTANLRVGGTVADPVILGRANVAGGDLLIFGNRYVLEPGTLDFINPVRTEPTVNLAARTTINEYNISLRLQGPLDRLHTSYNSDPSLPPVDIINLLAFGKTTEAAGANPSTSGTLGAESVLASGLGSQVGSRVEKIAGISHLSIDPALGSGTSNQQNPGARITIQQRVTGNLFVTFATDVTQTQNQVIQVEYRLTPRWSFSGVRDQNGGFGFDFRVRKEY